MTQTFPDHPTHHRPPGQVMRLSRLGSLHQCRLSFMRQLTRRMAKEGWQIRCAEFAVDDNGVGHAIYRVDTGQRSYALVAFSHDLPPDQRTDRVIAEAWDATFALVDGVPGPEDIARLAANVPKQEAGRVTEKELCLSRANRSVRLWSHVVEELSQGRQPERAALDSVGYLMRTTAVYGSGKFGAADRELIENRPEFTAPFQAEMLTVYLIRIFVRDLINHMAAAQGGANAVALDTDLASALGIGNSTGLGMAPFVVNHPILFNNWILAREEAIARVRALSVVCPEAWALVQDCVARVAAASDRNTSAHPGQTAKRAALSDDLERLQSEMAGDGARAGAWAGLATWAEAHLSPEGQECLLSLMLEPYPHLVDGLGHCMSDHLDASFRIDGERSVADTRAMLRAGFGWALDEDWSAPDATARAWYVSEEKLEPRLGDRVAENLAAYEQPLCTGREAAQADATLAAWPAETPIATVLLRHPEHRRIVRRAQIAQFAPYSEIHDNLLSAEMLPIDMLRAKLSFFGATDFDPRSDRWVRIKMFAGAPYPEDLCPETADRWVYPRPDA